MKLENQVASIEPSMRLVELGVKSHTSLYFYMSCGGMNYLRPRATTAVNPCDTLYPAYTVAELGEMFATIEEDALDSYMDDVKEPHLSADHTGRSLLLLFSTNPDFLCSMLIWLLENGHVTAEQINGEGS